MRLAELVSPRSGINLGVNKLLSHFKEIAMTLPPEGSKIRVEFDRGNQRVVIPYESNWSSRVTIGLFLSFWLAVWTFGGIVAIRAFVKGTVKSEESFFLIFWICGWAFGEGVVAYILYRLFRRTIPETITSGNSQMMYDSGKAPFKYFSGWSTKSQLDWWRKLFQKRKRLEFDQNHLNTLHLREFADGNRLTIDYGHERQELAVGSTELEREWLYGVIRDHYSLPDS